MVSRSEKIIVALDVRDSNEALRLADELSPHTSFFKVGLRLFAAEGPSIVRQLLDRKLKVFLDLKLHDIPNTVAGAIRSISDLGVQMTTIHLAGGAAMAAAAIAAKAESLRILGVTVLTSMDKTSLLETGVDGTPAEQVLRIASLGANAGIDGFVASAHEIEALRSRFGAKFQLVVPGIRPPDTEVSDQKRTMAPAEAIRLGAHHLVIGRPITSHPKPADALEQILRDIT